MVWSSLLEQKELRQHQHTYDWFLGPKSGIDILVPNMDPQHPAGHNDCFTEQFDAETKYPCVIYLQPPTGLLDLIK